VTVKKYISCFNFILITFLFSYTSLQSKPLQLLEADSALLTQQGNHNLGITSIYETGYIPTGILKVRWKGGLLTWLEGFGSVEAARFIDEDMTKLNAATAAVKTKFITGVFEQFKLYFLFKYRHAFGDPLMVRVDDEALPNVTHAISPYADGGQDIYGGILGRHSLFIDKKQYYYFFSVLYSRSEGRDYGDFTDDQKNRIHFMFAPEFHPSTYLMLAVENHVLYWLNRGICYEIIPQLRWEFFEYWLVEMGVGVPVLAGNNYRFIFGMKKVFQRN
jgi:hypothetical protein